jgi:threonine synthase
LGREPDCPEKFKGIEELPRRVKILPADVRAVKNYIGEIVRHAAN